MVVGGRTETERHIEGREMLRTTRRLLVFTGWSGKCGTTEMSLERGQMEIGIGWSSLGHGP